MAKQRYDLPPAVEPAVESTVEPTTPEAEQLEADSIEPIVVADEPTVEPEVIEDVVADEPELTPEAPVDEPEAPQEPEQVDIPELVQEEVIGVAKTIADVTPGNLNMLDISAIRDLLASDATPEEKLATIWEHGNPAFATLVEFLNTFKNTLDPASVMLPDTTIVGKHYDLYNFIVRTIVDENYEVFKVKFDIINMFFRIHSNGAFNDVALHRFSNRWKWGELKLRAFENLVIAISSLCDIEKRSLALKRLDLNKVLDKEMTGLSDLAIANVKKYYAM